MLRADDIQGSIFFHPQVPSAGTKYYTRLTFVGKYIIQVARFDPAKGIPDVLASYASFRERLDRESSKNDLAPPQLVM